MNNRKKNKKGGTTWTESGIRSIIKNEKYKGDVLLEKTFTVDPISKRRIENFGEEEQYYVENHHEPIVSREVWDQAQEIRRFRNRNGKKMVDGKREMYTRKFAFSSMCECGFCGTKLTRRTLHSNSTYQKPVWYCRTATQKGKELCPHSKSIDEQIIENAFLEAYGLLAENFDDVMESVLETVRNVIADDGDLKKLQKAEKELENLEFRRKRLTDMLLDDTISKEAYDEKYDDLTGKIQKVKDKMEILKYNVKEQKKVDKRMQEMRLALQEGDILDKFDRIVFESIVDKVIVGEINEDGSVDPYKLTFVLKGNGSSTIPDAKKHFKKSKSIPQKGKAVV